MSLSPLIAFCCIILIFTCCALESYFHLSRRSILTGVAATGAVWFGIENPVNADPLNALITTGSGGMLQQPYAEKDFDWASLQLATKLGTSRIGSLSLSPIQQALFQVRMYITLHLFLVRGRSNQL
jgi:hypothetical protein